MIYTEYDPLQSVIVGDTYAPGDVDHLLHKGNTSQSVSYTHLTLPTIPGV